MGLDVGPQLTARGIYALLHPGDILPGQGLVDHQAGGLRHGEPPRADLMEHVHAFTPPSPQGGFAFSSIARFFLGGNLRVQKARQGFLAE